MTPYQNADFLRALRRRLPDGHHVIVHTGQHYDRLMSEIFVEELGVPAPDHMLGVGSGTHGEQTARVIERLEPVLAQKRPELVLVPGDVNSTLAAALAAAKLGIRLNCQMSAKQARRFCALPPDAQRLLALAVARLGLSARGHDRLLKVARTIADLAGQESISAENLAEAIQYRGLDRPLFA